MSQKQWEPLTTAEAVIEAIKAGRHVEVRCTISPVWGKTTYIFGPLYFDWNVKNYGAEYRALIVPAQPAADELRGADVEPAGAVSAAAQKIAERVPLPEHDAYWTTREEDAIRAYGLAVAAEALRGDSPAATVEEISFDGVALLQWHIEPAPGMALFVAPQKALRGAEAVAKIERAPNGMIGLFRPDGGPFDMSKYVGAKLYANPPAGSVEVTDATRDAIDNILSRLNSWGKAYPTSVFREITDEDREWLHATRPGLMDRIAAGMGRHMHKMIAQDLAALTAALQEPEA